MTAPSGYDINTNRILDGFDLIGREFRNFIAIPPVIAKDTLQPNLMMTTGLVGLGKSFEIRQLVKAYNATVSKDKRLHMGRESPNGRNIGYLLWLHRDPNSILLLDDPDIIFRTRPSAEMLAVATDTTSRWIPSHHSTRGEKLCLEEGQDPPSFDFHGRIIVIANPNIRSQKLANATGGVTTKLVNRCAHHVRIDATKDQTYHYANYVVTEKSYKQMTQYGGPKEINEVLQLFAAGKDAWDLPNTRTLIQMLQKRQREKTRDAMIPLLQSFLRFGVSYRQIDWDADVTDVLWTYESMDEWVKRHEPPPGLGASKPHENPGESYEEAKKKQRGDYYRRGIRPDDDLLKAYRMLGLRFPVTLQELSAKHRELAKQYHPDITNDPNAHALMQQVNIAVATIKKWIAENG